jgi:hypothetical protein
MDPLRYLAETEGFFTRAQARDLGYSDRLVTQMIRGRIWRRLRRGYFTFVDLWDVLTPEGKHLALAHAVLHSLGDVVALCGVSGLVEHGVETWGMSLDRVHVSRLDGRPGRGEGDVVHHEGRVTGDDLVDIAGRAVLSAPRCAIEAGSRTSNESALVAFDSLLHQRLCTYDELMAQFERMAHWPFTLKLHVSVRMADGRSESVGETRARWLFRIMGLPAPTPQFEIRDSAGQLVATCDWGWPGHGVYGEFDGKVKYGRLLLPGQEPGDVVFAEKRREDLIREITQGSMVRLVWADLDRPRVTRDRIARLLRRAG